MKRILPLELVGCEELSFDLFDRLGKLLFPKGEKLTPGLLMKLCYMDLYRQEEAPPKKVNIKTKKKGPPPPPQSLISEKTKKNLLTNTRNILIKAYEGEPVKLEECEASTKLILEEVSDSMQKIKQIQQLRVHDEYTYSHNINVSMLSSAVGMTMKMSEAEIKELALAAFLHDIGKMNIPKNILNKPAKLEKKEFEIMKRHTSLGYKYIKKHFEVPDKIARVALDHHEKYIGSGYPNRLEGRMINKYSHITHIVDIYDALVSDRVYKKGIPSGKVLSIMSSEMKDDFNPKFFNSFLEFANVEELEKLLS